MRDLLICVLAMTWAWGLIWYLGRRKHPYERPDNIDREFREMVAKRLRPCLARLHHATVDGCNCRVFTLARTPRCAFMSSGGISRMSRRCLLPPRHEGNHDMRGLMGNIYISPRVEEAADGTSQN